jgi:murein L,D-transpeptidase YafK
MVLRSIVLAGVVLALAACQDDTRSTRHLAPIPPATMALMASKGLSKNDPILVRAYKKEAEMEVWKRGSDGQYALLKSFPICRWSGQLGPKVREGDRQAPEPSPRSTRWRARRLRAASAVSSSSPIPSA